MDWWIWATIMVGPNCRLHIPLGKMKAGKEYSLVKLTLGEALQVKSKCFSFITLLQIPPPELCALARHNTTLLIELCFSNYAMILGQKIWKSSWLRLQQRRESPLSWKSSVWSFSILLGENNELFSVNSCSVSEHIRLRGKGCPFPMQIWETGDFFLTSLSSWRKTSAARGWSKEQGNTAPFLQVMLGLDLWYPNPVPRFSWNTWWQLQLWHPNSFAWRYLGDLTACKL